MRRNDFDNWDMFKETKLLMHSSRGNHGYVTKTDMFYVKQIILAEISETLCCSTLNLSQNQKKTFCETKLFLGTSFPSSTSISA